MTTEIKIMSSLPPKQVRFGRNPTPELEAARALNPGKWFHVSRGVDIEETRKVQNRLVVAVSQGRIKHKLSCYFDGTDLIVYRPRSDFK